MDKYIKQFLEYLEVERGLSKKTTENYSFYLTRFADFAKQSDIITLGGDIESLYQEKDADMLYSLLGALAILALIRVDRRNKQRHDAISPKPPI